MRLDVYLASARILKTRSLVKSAVDEKMVYLNGRLAKAAASVKVDDIIEVDTPRFYKKIKVLTMPVKNMPKSKAAELYENLEERKKELA
ncbi:MAG: RNA-binding S4 domain-containing protein [candidate division Zixibacteria bacterium]|jgi:ribosomal 50S subunit-recycling heat shock protein|nr:RNA-binding S4 domain-containing protein [candidate division Zixibacteria bacterium]